MGLFSIPIYFRKAPTPQEVATAFEVMTGLPVSEEAHPEPVLLVYHPAHPTLPLALIGAPTAVSGGNKQKIWAASRRQCPSQPTLLVSP
jgi:hypothetical protein